MRRLSGGPAPQTQGLETLVRQMTWDCIEVFIPGFVEDFSRSLLGSSKAAEAGSASALESRVALHA